ncbi:MAG: carboxypeptidase regulatory-like domain-containing protein [Nitrospirae bacterium]|nr:carboxypeptidase regulatory-like domain-containing protein [Nitrospirota bacterium]
MCSFRSTEGSGLFIKGLVSLLVLVIFALGLQIGQAYGGTVTVSYGGEIQMNGGEPVRIAVDPTTGHIFVTSPLLEKISEYDENGDYVGDITGFAGPLSIAADGNGHLFVGDSEDRSVSVLDLNANPLYFLGAGADEFGLPGDIAVSQSGIVFVTDSSNDRVRVYDAATGNYQYSFGTYGSGNGQFKFPAGIACDDANQEVYVVDQNNGRVQVFGFNGTYKRFIGSFGAGNGRLTRPQGVFVKDGFVYVADAYQSAVEVFRSNGTFVTFAGSYGSGAGLLRIPMDVVVDGSTLFVANSDNLRIELFDISYFYSISGSVKTSAGTGVPNVVVTLSGDATGTATTDSIGNYTISNLVPGSYTLTPSATGFTFTSPLNVVITGSDLTSQNFTVASYNVSGAVTTSSGAGLATVSMNLSGTNTNGGVVNITTTTNTSGAYAFAGLLPGTYTLTPSKAGYTFTPASVTVSGADVTQNFVVQVYTISGAATTGSGTGISTVSVAIYIGAVKKTVTTAVTTGAYTITDVPVGNYTVTPTKTGYVFTPLNQSVTVSTANVTGVNFNSFTLSGTVKTSNNTAISGVLMTLSGGGLTANKTATTGTTGAYSIPGLGNGTYTLTPSKTGYTFTPASVTVSGADVTQDFVVQVYSISGTVKTPANVGISSAYVAIYIGGVKKMVSSAATTGAYTLNDVPVGTYTVTLSKTGYCFTPAAKVVTISSSNVVLNFIGAACGTTAMNVIAAAKGPDVINDAVIRVLDLSGNLISEFQTLSSYYGAKVAMGDLLGDDKYELIVSPGRGSQNAAQMRIYSYDGTLLASLASVANTSYGASVVSGDIDGDGKDEIVMSSLSSDMLNHTVRIYSVGVGYLLTQESIVSFTSSAPVTSPANVAVGNLDGTGNLELIVSYMSGDGSTNTVNVYTFDVLMNPTLNGSNSYPLGSTVSALNSGGGAIEDIVLGYTDSIDSIVKSVDINFTQVVAPVTVFANGGSAPALSAMDINSDGTLDLLAGMGDQPANPATLKIYPSGASPVDITAFESSLRGVNADFGVIMR